MISYALGHGCRLPVTHTTIWEVCCTSSSLELSSVC